MISVSNLTFSHNYNIIFDYVSFSVSEGQKSGVDWI